MYSSTTFRVLYPSLVAAILLLQLIGLLGKAAGHTAPNGEAILDDTGFDQTQLLADLLSLYRVRDSAANPACHPEQHEEEETASTGLDSPPVVLERRHVVAKGVRRQRNEQTQLSGSSKQSKRPFSKSDMVVAVGCSGSMSFALRVTVLPFVVSDQRDEGTSGGQLALEGYADRRWSLYDV